MSESAFEFRQRLAGNLQKIPLYLADRSVQSELLDGRVRSVGNGIAGFSLIPEYAPRAQPRLQPRTLFPLSLHQRIARHTAQGHRAMWQSAHEQVRFQAIDIMYQAL